MTLPSEADATKLVKRSILSKGIYEYWGSGTTYTELHSDVKERTKHLWTKYNQCSFRFEFESFRGTKSQKEQKIIIEDFAYLGFDGPIKMNNPDERFSILEEYDGITHLPLPDSERSLDGAAQTSDGQVETEVEGAMYLDPNIVRTPILRRVLFGRYLASSSRPAIETYDLKKRKYIGTTSMDAELSLITANLAQVSPGKIVYDPFVGTGSFVVASAHFGGMTLGSDIDGRAIRGAKGRSLFSNFVQYNLVSQHLDSFVSDLTNSPFRNTGSEGSDQFIDAIVCDPPYGIREGLKVLGARDLTKAKEVVVTKGVVRHLYVLLLLVMLHTVFIKIHRQRPLRHLLYIAYPFYAWSKRDSSLRNTSTTGRVTIYRRRDRTASTQCLSIFSILLYYGSYQMVDYVFGCLPPTKTSRQWQYQHIQSWN